MALPGRRSAPADLDGLPVGQPLKARKVLPPSVPCRAGPAPGSEQSEEAHNPGRRPGSGSEYWLGPVRKVGKSTPGFESPPDKPVQRIGKLPPATGWSAGSIH